MVVLVVVSVSLKVLIMGDVIEYEVWCVMYWGMNVMFLGILCCNVFKSIDLVLFCEFFVIRYNEVFVWV